MLKLKIKKLHEDAKIPTKGTEYSAGFDLSTIEDVALQPGQRKKIKTGLAFEIPNQYFGYLRPRSSVASNGGVNTCSSDIVDSDYRGEVLITMINLSDQVYQIEKGQRIAQMVIIPIPNVEVEEVFVLEETKRGQNGHGSTGTK